MCTMNKMTQRIKFRLLANQNNFRVLTLFFGVFIVCLVSSNSLLAQEASLKIQKNIVERIDRLDEYIRDTIDPNMLQNNKAAWARLKNLKDSLEVLQFGIRNWSVYQDSISSMLLNQQDLIGSQQRMIDAINWQIKDVLRENSDLKQEVGSQTTRADQLVLENLNLQNKLRILSQSNDSLAAKWNINEQLLREILAIAKDNQQVIKTIPSDSVLVKPTHTDTTSSIKDF